MGLTLHYRLTAPAGCTARRAEALVRRFHEVARGWLAAGRVVCVDDVMADRGFLERFGTAWLAVPHPAEPATRIGVAIRPEAGWIFPVDFGADCEWLWLGLCRYPSSVEVAGRNRATRLGARWQFARSAKTQYASLRGWENFLRCHVGAVELLGEWRTLGGSVRIQDEGGYWPRRNLALLRQRLDQSNAVVAAFAGALKDTAENAGRPPVQSPIFAHPQFERLEAEGVARNGDRLAKAARIVSSLTRPTDRT